MTTDGPTAGPAEAGRHVTPRWRDRAGSLLVALLLSSMVVSAVPWSWGGLRGPLNRTLARIGLRQSWSMYVPDAGRRAAALLVYATMPDGSRRLLPGCSSPDPWGVQWAGTKSGWDVWRAQALGVLEGGSKERQWYLRAVCVREARRGAIPLRVSMEAHVRAIRSPKAVRDGAEPLGPLERQFLGAMDCGRRDVAAMIEEDRRR